MEDQILVMKISRSQSRNARRETVEEGKSNRD